MQQNFWFKKWESTQLGFHQKQVNPKLTEHFHQLNLVKGSRVFLPLCGKTLDISWLLEKGYKIAGSELVKIAVDQLFEELKIKPKISKIGKLTLYKANNIDIFVGDIFDLTAQELGKINAIYDRAALVALPEKMRKQYSAHLIKITQQAPQLLISFEYNQNLMQGPPFSINAIEVQQHYGKYYNLIKQSCLDIPGGLKGKCPAVESIWLLKGTSKNTNKNITSQ